MLRVTPKRTSYWLWVKVWFFFCALRCTILGAFAEPCMHACNLGSGLVTAHVCCTHRDATPSQCATKGCLSRSHAHIGWQNPGTPQKPPRLEGHSGSLHSHRHRASPLLITCWGLGPGRTSG